GVKANVDLANVPIGYVKPIAERYNVTLRGGVLSAAGTVEYAPDGGTLAQLREVSVDGLDVGWVHMATTKANQAQVGQQAKETAKTGSNEPSRLLRVDRARIGRSTFGFVNAAVEPSYRVYLSDGEVEVKNLSNHFAEGTAEATVRGKFLGSGPTTAHATFRPEKDGPDMDLAVRVENTDMRTMNDLLRAYGKFDVVRGTFSFYSELTVRNGQVQGYVK